MLQGNGLRGCATEKQILGIILLSGIIVCIIHVIRRLTPLRALSISHDGPRRFLDDQFHGLVLAATVQRAGIYRSSAPESLRNEFRIGLRQALNEYARAYDVDVSDAAHTNRIGALAEHLSHSFSSALVGGRFRVGPAQKALNLFLKYRWSAGWIPTPPHCPFDAVIMQALPYSARISWTKLDSLDEYRALVAVARRVAGATPLAEWELVQYEKRSPAARRAGPV